jgi:hypothetical protein
MFFQILNIYLIFKNTLYNFACNCFLNIAINSKNITYVNMVKYSLLNPHTYDLLVNYDWLFILLI